MEAQGIHKQNKPSPHIMSSWKMGACSESMIADTSSELIGENHPIDSTINIMPQHTLHIRLRFWPSWRAKIITKTECKLDISPTPTLLVCKRHWRKIKFITNALVLCTSSSNAKRLSLKLAMNLPVLWIHKHIFQTNELEPDTTKTKSPCRANFWKDKVDC